MRPLRTTLALIALSLPCLVPASCAEQDGARGAAAPAAATPAPARPAGLARTRFVPNRGQWHDSVRYAVLGDTAGWLHDDGFTLRFERWSAEAHGRPGARTCSGAVVRTRFVGAAAEAFAVGERLAARHHFLVGDRERHARDLPAFADVTMRRVLPGVDVRFRPLPDGGRGPFEYDLLLAPGADLGAFVAECDGVERLRVDADGRLVAVVATPAGERELVQQAPVAWQETPDGRRAVPVAFRLLGTTRYGFVADSLDARLATVVDPGVVWGSFLGGGASDRIHDVHWQQGVGVWVGGWSGSTDLPTTVGAFQTVGVADGFVGLLSEDGQTLQFLTWLGGSGGEEVRGIAIGPGQQPVVVGFTSSVDFPLSAGAAQPAYAGGSIFLNLGDAFVTRLASDGSALVSSTYLGGLFDDIAEDVAVDGNGNAVVVGWTSSSDFPVPPGGFQPAFGGLPIAQSDGFVVGVDPTGTQVAFGTFLGGPSGEQLLAIDRDPVSGDLAVAGWCIGAGYPTTPFVAGPSSAGGIDVVLTRLTADASAAVFSTYIGGLNEDAAQAVAFAADGSVWVGGFTGSSNYPATLGAPQQTFAGAYDGFLTRVTALGQALVSSTFLGGPGQDRVRDLALSAAGMMVVGEAGDAFPVTVDAPQPQFAGGAIDGFVSYLTNGGSTLSWSTYFGGAGQDSLQAVSFDDGGLATVGGFTFSPDFPVAPPALQPQLLGVQDGVLLQLDLLSDLGPGVQVDPVGEPSVDVVAPGDVDLLKFDLVNVTDRQLLVDSVRVFVCGAGVTPATVRDLRVLRGEGAAAPVVGGLAQLSFGQEVEVALAGASLPPRSATRFSVVVRVDADPVGRSVEVGAAIVGADAWQLSAPGAGGGPTVGIDGPGRVTGPVSVVGAVAGDLDGSGARTVVDVRRLLNALGGGDIAADVDGDDVLTPVDVVATRDAVLGLGTVFAAPPTAARDSWLKLRCLLPGFGAVQASLGGRSLTVGRAMPRELSLLVAHDHPLGVQELVVTLDGQVVFTGFVDVF